MKTLFLALTIAFGLTLAVDAQTDELPILDIRMIGFCDTPAMLAESLSIYKYELIFAGTSFGGAYINIWTAPDASQWVLTASISDNSRSCIYDMGTYPLPSDG
jgi:hypothetical protein